jgi:hypothetical protein
MDILHSECFGTDYEAVAHCVSPAQYAQTYPELAVLEEQDTGFQCLIPANENGRHSSVFKSVRSDEIAQVRREVVLLTATQAKFLNCREKCPKLSLPENQLGGSFAGIERGAGSSAHQGRKISQHVFDIEQSS